MTKLDTVTIDLIVSSGVFLCVRLPLSPSSPHDFLCNPLCNKVRLTTPLIVLLAPAPSHRCAGHQRLRLIRHSRLIVCLSSIQSFSFFLSHTKRVHPLREDSSCRHTDICLPAKPIRAQRSGEQPAIGQAHRKRFILEEGCLGAAEAERASLWLPLRTRIQLKIYHTKGVWLLCGD